MLRKRGGQADRPKGKAICPLAGKSSFVCICPPQRNHIQAENVQTCPDQDLVEGGQLYPPPATTVGNHFQKVSWELQCLRSQQRTRVRVSSFLPSKPECQTQPALTPADEAMGSGRLSHQTKYNLCSFIPRRWSCRELTSYVGEWQALPSRSTRHSPAHSWHTGREDASFELSKLSS